MKKYYNPMNFISQYTLYFTSAGPRFKKPDDILFRSSCFCVSVAEKIVNLKAYVIKYLTIMRQHLVNVTFQRQQNLTLRFYAKTAINSKWGACGYRNSEATNQNVIETGS